MKKKMKRIVSCLLAYALLCGTLPIMDFSSAIEVQPAAAQMNFFPQSLIDRFNLQRSYEQVGSLKAENSMFKNFTNTKNTASSNIGGGGVHYPGGLFQFQAANTNSDAPWKSEFTWQFTAEEREFIGVLISNDNQLRLGASVELSTDTQNGSLAGSAAMTTLYHQGNGHGYIQLEKTSNTNKNFEKQTSGWYGLAKDCWMLRVEIYGTKGYNKWWIGVGDVLRNFARARYPQVYIQDYTAPHIKSVSYNKYNNTSDSYVLGDEVYLTIVFNEPVRAANDNNFCHQLNINIGGKITDWDAVSYDDRTCTLVVKHTVKANESIVPNAGTAVNASIRYTTGIRDLAGNPAVSTTATSVTLPGAFGLDGTLSKIASIKPSFVIVKDDSGKYRKMDTAIALKTGDVFAFEVTIAPSVRNMVAAPSYFPIDVGGIVVNAVPGLVYNSGGVLVANNRMDVGNDLLKDQLWAVDQNDIPVDDNYDWHYSIPTTMDFSKVIFIAKIPEDVGHSATISIPATKNGQAWEITRAGNFTNNAKGNLSLVDMTKRKPLGTLTAITAGDALLPTIHVDTKPPFITITDAAGASADVYDKGSGNALHTIKLGEKPGSYKIAFKADEELLNDVAYKIYCIPWGDNASAGTLIASGNMKVYKTARPEELECVSFEILENTDNVINEYYIDLVCFDRAYNPYDTEQNRKWFLGDKVAPDSSILDRNLRLSEGDTEKYYEFVIEAHDAASPDGMRLYYNFSSEGDKFKFAENKDNSAATQSFTVASEVVAGDVVAGGTFTYYIVDANDNQSNQITANYYMGELDIGDVELVDPEDVAQYGKPRDVWFSGFVAATEEYEEYLKYKIGADGLHGYLPYNPEGDTGRIAIPEGELQESCTIFYAKVRKDLTGDGNDLETAEYRVDYHCDSKEPGIQVTATESGGSLINLGFAAPATVGHPKNVTAAKLTIIPQFGEPVELDISGMILAGQLSYTKRMEDLLTENGYPSGRYRIALTVEDANEHSSTEVYPESGYATVLFERPVVREVAIKAVSSGDPYADGKPYLLTVSRQDGLSVSDLSITDAVITEGIAAGCEIKADKYYLNALIEIPYAGDYDGEGRVEYDLSENGGVTWSGFQTVPFAKAVTTDNGKLTFEVCLELPEQEQDGVYQYSIKYYIVGNEKESPTCNVTVGYDRTAPDANAVAYAVGEGETWNQDLAYTAQNEKAAIYVGDAGFSAIRPSVEITSISAIVDGKAVPVAAGDFDDYISGQPVYNPEINAFELVIRDTCLIDFTVADVFGNMAELSYITKYVDRREMINEVKTVGDGSVFVITGDVAETEFYLRGVSAADTSEEQKQSFWENIGVLFDFEMISEESAEREGDFYRVYRMRQKSLATAPLKISFVSTDRYGARSAAIDCLTLQSVSGEVTVSPYTNSVSGLGNVVRTFQRLEFNVPVTMISKALIEEDADTAEQIKELVGNSSRSFGRVAYAVLNSAEDASFYAADRFGMYTEIDLDVTGTNFTSYPNYSIEYYVDKDGIDLRTDEQNNFGLYAPAKVIVRSAAIGVGSSTVYKSGIQLPDADALLQVDAAMSAEHTVLSGWYAQMVLENSQEYEEDSASYAQRITMQDSLTKETYQDILYFERFDILKPQLIEAIHVSKNDIYASQKVIYLFYDASGVGHMEGSFTEQAGMPGNLTDLYFNHGVYLAQYEKNGQPDIRVTDTAGNPSAPALPLIDTVAASTVLKQGVDFDIVATTDGSEACADGVYYRTVFAEAVPIPGGKPFTGGEVVELTSPDKYIFKLSDSKGNVILAPYYPPIDVTPPKVYVSQAYTYDSITIAITVSDTQSGVKSVTLDSEALTEIAGVYSKVLHDNNAHTLVVEDHCGNRTTRILYANRVIYEELFVTASQDISEPTNQRVIVTLHAPAGRKPVYSIGAQPEGYLTQNDVLLANNQIMFFQNGKLRVTCTDEMGRSFPYELEVTNIKRTPPKVQGIITPDEITEYGVAYATGRSVSIRFKAENEEEDIPGAVFLINESRVRNTGGTALDEAMMEYFNNLAGNLAADISLDTVIPRQDITDEDTRVIISRPGRYTFTLEDYVGNTTTATVTIDGSHLDLEAPALLELQWSYQYLTVDDQFKEFMDATGNTMDVKTETIITGSAETPRTNQSVRITVVTDEAVKQLGYDTRLQDYARETAMVFKSNGKYTFNLLDMANNLTQATVDLDLIEKRIPQFEFNNDVTSVSFFEAEPDAYDKETFTGFRVYRVENGQKVYLSEDQYHVEIDWGGFDPDNFTQNTFSRTSPYVIRYTLWDSVGNKREAQKTFILVSKQDTVVTVNGKLPNEFSEIIIAGGEAVIEVKNYAYKSYAMMVQGEFSASLRKNPGSTIQPDTGTRGTYTLQDLKQGWHTIAVTTQHQDYIVIHIYVTR